MAKIRNFDIFGGCIPTFLPEKREIWHGKAERRAWLRLAQAYNNNNNNNNNNKIHKLEINMHHL